MNPAAAAQLAKIFGILFTILGSPFLILSLVFLVIELNFRNDALPAKAVVVDIVQKASTDSDNGSRTTYHYPVFQYQDAHGNQHRVESSLGSGSPSVEVGQSVDLLYRPNDPKSVRMEGEAGRWVMVGVFGFFGILFVGIGLFLAVVVPKIARRSEPRPA